MPRNGAGVYSLPAGLPANGDTSDADEDLRVPLEDVATDLNTPRPILAGGTGADNAVFARKNLGLNSFKDLATLLANTTLSYSGSGAVASGSVITTQKEGFSYEVASSTVTDHHVTTAGGVKLYAFPDLSAPALHAGAFGFKPSGDQTLALEKTINAVSIGEYGGVSRHRMVQLPAGLVDISGEVGVAPLENNNRLIIRGAGQGNTVLRGTHTVGALLRVMGARVSIEDMTLSADAARKAGGGAGAGILTDDGITTTTQFRFAMNRVTIENQPGHGLHLAAAELADIRNCDFNDNVGDGLRQDNAGHSIVSAWSSISNLRASGNGGYGIYNNNVPCVHYVNPQCFNNAALDGQFHVRGGAHNLLIETPDVEAFSIADGGTAYVGLKIQGSRNIIVRGLKGFALNTTCLLENCAGITIDRFETGNNGLAWSQTHGLRVTGTSSAIDVLGVRPLADYSNVTTLFRDEVFGGALRRVEFNDLPPYMSELDFRQMVAGAFPGGGQVASYMPLAIRNNFHDAAQQMSAGMYLSYLVGSTECSGEIKHIANAANNTNGKIVISPSNGGVPVDSLEVGRFDITVRGGKVFMGTAGQFMQTGTGTPEGVITAPIGSTFLRTNGGAGTTLYVKESGTGNTGWVAK